MRKILLSIGLIFLILFIYIKNREVENQLIIKKTEVKKPIEQNVIAKQIIFSINDNNYTVNDLPINYQKLSAENKKKFLSKYLNYKIILDTIPAKNLEYKDRIEQRLITKELLLKEREIVLKPTELTLIKLRTTLELIAEEEVAKKYKNLENKIKIFYNKNINSYHYPQHISIAHIILKDENQTKKIFFEIKESKKPLAKLAQLAYQYSLDKDVKSNYGFIGDLTKKEVGEEFYNTIWKTTEKTLVQHPIKKGDFYHIVFLLKKREAGISNFNDVKDDIRRYLLIEKRKKWINNLYRKVTEETTIHIFDDFNNSTFSLTKSLNSQP